MIAEYEDGSIWFTTSYAERSLIKQLPGVRFDRKRSQWYMHATWVACLTMRSLFKEALELGPKLKDWAWEEITEEEMLHDLSQRFEYNGVAYDSRLFGYQAAGAEFMAYAKRAILADEPGLGKTAQTISALRALKYSGIDIYPILVICPNGVKRTWEDEFRQWWPDGPAVQVVAGSAAQRRKQLTNCRYDVDVINWESVRLHSSVSSYGSIRLKACGKCGGIENPRSDEEYKSAVPESKCERHPRELNLNKYKTVIVDEAHNMKDPNAKQTRAVWSVLHSAKYRYCLTGTPIADNVGDLWSILHGLDGRAFPVRSKFLDTFATTHLNFYGGYEILGLRPERKETFQRILNAYMRRIPKSVALPQLPPRLPTQFRYVAMRPVQAKQYKQMQDGMLTLLDSGTPIAADRALSQFTRLRQFACATGGEENGKIRLADPSCKVEDLLEFIADNPGPLVVAAPSKQLINLAAKRLGKEKYKYGLITGDQSIDERHVTMLDFQAGKFDLVLLTTGAGGEGITLTRADTIYFMERSYSALENSQTEDRVYRIGSEIHDAVRVVVCITEGTIEDNRECSLAVKNERFEEVVQDKARMRRMLA